MTTYKRLFTIQDKKPSYAKWFVGIDISSWLGSNTISNASFSAKDLATGVSAEVVDAAKSTFSSSEILPYIKSGTTGHKYRVTMQVEASDGDSFDEFYLDFKVKDL